MSRFVGAQPMISGIPFVPLSLSSEMTSNKPNKRLSIAASLYEIGAAIGLAFRSRRFFGAVKSNFGVPIGGGGVGGLNAPGVMPGCGNW